MMKGGLGSTGASGEFPYAAIWVRDTIPAMTRGTVTGSWDWRHRRVWLRQRVNLETAVAANEQVKMRIETRRSVIPAKAGIDFRRWNKTLDESPQRCAGPALRPGFQRNSNILSLRFTHERT